MNSKTPNKALNGITIIDQKIQKIQISGKMPGFTDQYNLRLLKCPHIQGNIWIQCNSYQNSNDIKQAETFQMKLLMNFNSQCNS